MNLFNEVVLAFLGPIEPEELPFVMQAIEDCEKKGWLPEEAASYLRWCEHVDPVVSEDVALRHMRAIRERVELRLATK